MTEVERFVSDVKQAVNMMNESCKTNMECETVVENNNVCVLVFKDTDGVWWQVTAGKRVDKHRQV